MDPLSDIVALLRPQAVFSQPRPGVRPISRRPVTGRGSWGVFYTGYEAPSFCLVLEGGCWFAIENTTPRRLERGDFMLLPTTPACSFFSQPDAQFGSARPWVEEVRHGEQEGEPDFKMLGGAFQIERVNASLLLQVLPDIIHVRSAEYDTNRLATIIDLIIDEGIEERAGREAILEHLLKVMLIECFRRPGLSQEPLPAGLLAGMRDPSIASTLRAMHSDVRHGWTVAELSKHAGMSRSSFAEHFGATMGCAPIEYLTRWRMSLAQDALDRGRIPHIKLASDLGYASVSAFSTAFRRRVGCSPGAFARGRSAAASR